MFLLRKATRDAILYADATDFPSAPNNIEHQISVPYPTRVPDADIYAYMLYSVARDSGYEQDESTFISTFGSYFNNSDNGAIIVQKLSKDEFPQTGIVSGLYIDITEQVAYYWDASQLVYKRVSSVDFEDGTILFGGSA